MKCSQKAGAFCRETEEKKEFTYSRTRVSKHRRRSEGGEGSGGQWGSHLGKPEGYLSGFLAEHASLMLTTEPSTE